MTTAQLATTPIFRAFDNNGVPLAGGLLYTYAAGTTTLQASYPSSSQVTPNTNPIVLNFRGEAAVWLDPTLAYKLLLTDSLGNTIAGYPVDNIQGQLGVTSNITPSVTNTYNLGSASSTWANGYFGTQVFIGGVAAFGNNIIGSFGTTAAETTASVTPTNFSYPPLNVLRYGATGNGTTDDTPAFQAAFNVAKVAGGTVLIPTPSNYYLLLSSLDLTIAAAATNTAGFNVQMQANQHFSANSTTGSIHGQHTGHIFDCTGNSAIQFYDLCVTAGTTGQVLTQPKTCFLLARNSSGSSTVHRFNNCRVYGYFSNTVFYNYGCEDEVLVGCFFQNYATTANTRVCVWTANNISSLTSSFVTIATGAQSCRHHHVVGGDFNNAGGQTTSDVFYFDQVFYSEFLHPWVACASGRSIFYIDPTNATSSTCSIIDLEMEAGSSPSQGLQFSNPGSTQTPTNWMIESSYWGNVTNVLNAGTNVTFSGLRMRNCYTTTGNVNIPGTASYSFIECDALTLVIGTVANSTLIGASNNWTITTRTASKFIDTSTAANRTWTPSVGSFGGSSLVIASNEFISDGTLCTVTFSIHGTAMTYTAGVAITGLPFAATKSGNLVSVYDQTTTTYIGAGWVDGNGLHLANGITSTTDTYVVTAQYFVA